MNTRTNFADDFQTSAQEPLIAAMTRNPTLMGRINEEVAGDPSTGHDNTPEPAVASRPQLPFGEADKYFVYTWTNPSTKANKYYIKALPQFLASAEAIVRNRWDRAAIKYLTGKGDTTEKTLVKVLTGNYKELAENLEQLNSRESMALARQIEERISYLGFLIASSEMELTGWASRERDRDRNASDNPSYLKKLQFRIDCARDLAVLGAVMANVFPVQYSGLTLQTKAPANGAKPQSELEKRLKRAIYNQQDQLTRKYCNAEAGPVVANKAELSEADQAELDAA